MGVHVVEYLEGPHMMIGFDIDEFKEIKRFYASKARELRKAQE